MQLAHKEGEAGAQRKGDSPIIRYVKCKEIAKDSVVELLYPRCEQPFRRHHARKGKGNHPTAIGDHGSSRVVHSFEAQIQKGEGLSD